MTTNEFSDMFTTLLNSHAEIAQFGEGSSKREVVLDEYEKSVILTQSQDIVIKSYFDRTLNSQAQGYDDTPRRQVDFSSLTKVAELTPIQKHREDIKTFDWKITTNTGTKNYGKVTVSNLMNFPMTVIFRQVYGGDDSWSGVRATYSGGKLTITLSIWDIQNVLGGSIGGLDKVLDYIRDNTTVVINNHEYDLEEVIGFSASDYGHEELPDANQLIAETVLKAYKQYNYTSFDDRGILFQMPPAEDGRNTTDVLFILNEKMVVGNKDYVIIPISHQEYDREMSRPYSQPLKKQAWRLFQNKATGFDVQSEIIPKWNINAANARYKIRYVRRPVPIILTDLPDSLSIDGVTSRTECELHPILHMDILNKAVEIAIATRGYNVQRVGNAQEKA